MRKNIAILLVLAALLPLPVLAQSTPSSTMAPGSTPESTTSTPTGKTTKRSTKSTTVVVDVNTAPAAELQKVRGIGEATAKKIVAGRPYASLDELVSKKAMTAKQFAALKSQLTVTK